MKPLINILFACDTCHFFLSIVCNTNITHSKTIGFDSFACGTWQTNRVDDNAKITIKTTTETETRSLIKKVHTYTHIAIEIKYVIYIYICCVGWYLIKVKYMQLFGWGQPATSYWQEKIHVAKKKRRKPARTISFKQFVKWSCQIDNSHTIPPKKKPSNMK